MVNANSYEAYISVQNDWNERDVNKFWVSVYHTDKRSIHATIEKIALNEIRSDSQDIVVEFINEVYV